MRLLATIVAHEWRLLRITPLALGGWILVSILAGYAALNGARWADAVEARLDATRVDETTRLEAMRAEVAAIAAGQATPARFRDPMKASWVGEFLGNRFARWPVAPLTAWAIGQRDLVPAYLKVSLLSRDAWFFDDEIENPLHLALGRFDLGYVIIAVLPLLLLALSFDLLSAEREAGTLPLLLSQPVRLRTVVAAKAVVRLAWAAIFVLTTISVSVLLAPPDLSLATTWRVLLWASAAFVYAAIWIGLAAFVNVFSGSPAANAVRLTALWMLLVVVVPAVLSLVATARYPTPPRIDVHERQRALQSELAPRTTEILETYYQQHPSQRPSSVDRTDWAPRFYAVQRVRDEALAARYEAHDAQVTAQQALVDRWRWLTPALVAQGIFHDLAGTSPRDMRRFLSQALTFHETWQNFFFPRLFARTPMSTADYDRIPAFVFEPEPDAAVANRVSRGLALLLVTCGIIAAGCRWRLAKGYG